MPPLCCDCGLDRRRGALWLALQAQVSDRPCHSMCSGGGWARRPVVAEKLVVIGEAPSNYKEKLCSESKNRNGTPVDAGKLHCFD